MQRPLSSRENAQTRSVFNLVCMTSNIMGQPADPENYGIQKGHVNVVVRVRPLNNSERFANESNVLQFPGNGGIVATSLDKEVVIKNFTFNVVFEPEATQKDVFEHCGVEEVVDYALAGYSTTCICYGQTGSGKTHTLSGPPNLVSIISIFWKIVMGLGCTQKFGYLISRNSIKK